MDPQTAVSVRVKNSINSSPHFTQSLIVSLLLFLFSISLRCIIVTSSFARFARSATSPSFAYVSNPVPDSSLCRAAAPRLRPLQLLLSARLHRSVSTVILLSSRLASASAATRRLRSLQLLLSFASVSAALLPDCVRFGYCSPIASTSTLLPNGVRFVCCSPIVSASTLLRPLHLLLPDCIRFNCCSPIASASAAAPRLRPLQLCSPMASASSAAPRLCPLQLCSPMASASSAAPRLFPLQLCCIHFICCSPIASASTAAPRLRPLRLLLPDCVRFNSAPQWRPLRLLLPDCVRFNSAPQWRPLRLLLPDCIRFNCCSPIASASAAAPRQLFWKIPACPLFLKILRRVRGSVN